jgi:hypothetical protein
MLYETGVRHEPVVGVNVYVPVVVLLIVDGDQVPVIPLFDVSGKGGTVAPLHNVDGRENVEDVPGLTVTSMGVLGPAPQPEFDCATQYVVVPLVAVDGVGDVEIPTPPVELVNQSNSEPVAVNGIAVSP